MLLRGKMEALAVLLQKLKARGHRVLVLTQMIPVLDILELFLNFDFLTYKKVNESGAHSWHYLESIKNFNQDKRFSCAVLSSHTPSTGVSHVGADTVVFYDTDLDPLMDTKAKEWCDNIARDRDTYTGL